MTSYPVIHYNPSTNPLRMTEHGRGACCGEGLVTGYVGLVTCPECAELAVAKLQEEADNANIPN